MGRARLRAVPYDAAKKEQGFRECVRTTASIHEVEQSLGLSREAA
jgi:hypothetical protein